MVDQLIYALIVCIVIGVVWWVCDYLPVPEPLNKLIKILSIVIGVIVIIYALLAVAGVASLR